MKKSFMATSFPENGTNGVIATKAIDEIERRIVNQQRNLPATAVELEWDTSKAIARAIVTITGTPEDIVQYLVARARTGNGAADPGAPE